jgi:hypothetical protein
VIAYLADAIIGVTDEFVSEGLVIGEDACCPEGSIRDRGVEDVLSGFGDGALGRVIDTEGDQEGKRAVHHFVGGILLESEGVCNRDVGYLEGGARAVAGRYLGRGGIDEADKGAGDIDRNILCVEELGVIAAMPNKEFLFDAGVWVGEGTALWLEDGLDVFVGRDDVEPCEEVVVRESNDTFRGGE